MPKHLSLRALTVAAALAIGALSPVAAPIHAEPNTGGGSGSGSSKVQCETLSGYYNPKTLEKYKAGTKLDEGTTVGDTYSGKQWTCNKDGAWQQVIRHLPVRQVSRLPAATLVAEP